MSAGQVLRLVFWVSVAGILYAYVGYPILLLLLARLRSRPVRSADITPEVSLIITVHNAATTVVAKIENSLALDYPRDRFGILIASDASTDDTDRLATGFADRGVVVCRAPHRVGKTGAQNLACRAATGEILVFSDVTTLLPMEALRAIVRPFADPEVGLVSGQDESIADTDHPAAAGEGAYVRYEMWLRRLESTVGSIIGASGCLYAVRRSQRSELSADLVEDFSMPLLTLQAGARAVAEPAARAGVPVTGSSRAEFRRRVRTQIGGAVALWRHRHLLNPFRYPKVAWMLLSHKLGRWLVPGWLVLLLLSGSFLARDHWFYLAATIAQTVFHGLGLFGLRRSCRRRSPRWLSLPFSFLLANAAVAIGTVQAIRGGRATTWQPSARPLLRRGESIAGSRRDPPYR
jgi:cellulose synthase/poly-beta-1,6-N-acetylglucosamine synthase-like glycosyltransferase